jgi:hypothetical protein
MKANKELKKAWKNIIFNILSFAIILGTIVLFYKNILLTCILLTILFLIAFIKWKSRITILIFFLAGLLGFFTEAIGIRLGIWIYSVGSILNVPLWISFAWGGIAAFVYQSAEEIKKMGVKDKI